jgi:hypothetical protein
MHGGAPGSGAPEGSKNGAYVHGGWTKDARAEMQKFRHWLHIARGSIDSLE